MVFSFPDLAGLDGEQLGLSRPTRLSASPRALKTCAEKHDRRFDRGKR